MTFMPTGEEMSSVKRLRGISGLVSGVVVSEEPVATKMVWTLGRKVTQDPHRLALAQG